MNNNLINQCNLFLDNYKVIDHVFAWDGNMMALAAASVFTENNVHVSEDILSASRDLLKSKTSIFSDYRSNIKVPMICKMALSSNPEEYFAQVDHVYHILNKKKILGSEYRVLAAMSICDHVSKDNYESIIDKTNAIYASMKENHPFLTSDEDVTFAAMLAISGIDLTVLTEKMETAYNILKKEFTDRNALQSLSHVLSLYQGSMEDICQKVFDIYTILKNQKHRFSSDIKLVSLGVLALTDADPQSITDGIIEADEYLKEYRGLGNFVLGATERRMFASQLVLSQYHSATPIAGDSLLSSALAITIAAEVCMIACTNAAVVAANSAH